MRAVGLGYIAGSRSSEDEDDEPGGMGGAFALLAGMDGAEGGWEEVSRQKKGKAASSLPPSRAVAAPVRAAVATAQRLPQPEKPSQPSEDDSDSEGM